VQLYQVFIFLHVLGAIAAFGPGFAAMVVGPMVAKEPQHGNFYARTQLLTSKRLVTPVALSMAVAGVYVLTGVQLAGEPLGIALAFANAALFAAYIVLAHRVARQDALEGIDGLAAAMLIAAVAITPIGGWQVVPALGDPVALLAGVGVGICSSVIPYVSDQLAMRRLTRATYALMVSLLPATATVIGIVVLTQIPSSRELTGVALVIAGVAIHREPPEPRPRSAPAGSAGRPARASARA